MDNPPTGVAFSEDFEKWVMMESVRSYEADLFRRLAIGHAMMTGEWAGGGLLVIEMNDRLRRLLDDCLAMRRTVMDEDVRLVRTAHWEAEIPRSVLVKEVARMVCANDYQSAKRWIEENLVGQPWFHERRPKREGRGRRGMACYFGFEPEVE